MNSKLVFRRNARQLTYFTAAAVMILPVSVLAQTSPAGPAPIPAHPAAPSPAPAPIPAATGGAPTPAAPDAAPSYLPAMPTRTLTLEQVLQLTTANQYVSRRDALTIDRSRQGIAAAKAGLNPTIHPEASATVSSTTDTTTSSATSGISFNRESARASLSGNYVLADGGIRRDNVRIAEEDLRQSRDIVAAGHTASATVATTAYYALLQQQREYEASKVALTSAQELLRAANERLAIGQVTKGDVLTAQATVSAAIAQAQTDVQNLTRDRARLVTVLGLDPVTTVPQVTDPADLNTVAEDLDTLVREVARVDPTYDQLLSQKASAGYVLNQVQAERQPIVSVGADAGLALRSKNSGQHLDPFLAASVNVSFPDVNHSSLNARTRLQQDEVALRSVAADEYLNTVKEQVADAYTDYLATWANVAQNRVALASAQQAQVLALGRYSAGTGTQADVLASLSLLARAQLDLERTLSDRDVAIRTLLFISGHGVPGTSSSAPAGR